MEGYHGPTTIEAWVKWARNRMRRNQHVVVMVTGEPGRGKSSLALTLGSKIDEGFNPGGLRDRLTFRAKDVPRMAKKLPRYSVIDVDEAINEGGNRRRAMAGDNVALMTYLDTCRKMNLCHFFLYPFFEQADTAVQVHAMWVFDVDRLGHCTAHSVERVGSVKKKGIWLEDRFEFEFPDTRRVKPDLWDAYQAIADEFVYGRARDEEYLEDVERVKGVILDVCGT